MEQALALVLLKHICIHGFAFLFLVLLMDLHVLEPEVTTAVTQL